MARKIEELTVAELSELVRQGTEYHTHGCGGVKCSECPIDSDNFEGEIGNCREILGRLKKRLAKLTERMQRLDTETFETITVNPEVTNPEYLFKTGYIHVLAEVFSDDVERQRYCNGRSCSTCKLSETNFHEEFKRLGSCSKARDAIIKYSRAYKLFSDMQCSTENQATCSDCGYLDNQGDYKFCTAWRNYTTENMHCGYYKPIDK